MTRRTMKLIVGVENLARMTAKGSNGSEAIPDNIFKTVLSELMTFQLIRVGIDIYSRN